MSRKLRLWVISLMATLALAASLLVVSPATANTDFNPSEPTTNDAVGVIQDWFMVAEDPNGFFSWFYDEAGTNGIPANERVYTNGVLNFTVYARHYQGQVKSFPLEFTNNTSGTVAPNTVSVYQMEPCSTVYGSTAYGTVFHDTYDGTGLSSTQLRISVIGDKGSGHLGDPSHYSGEVADGGSLDMGPYTLHGRVYLMPGWFTITPWSYNSGTGVYGPGTSIRLWVPSCSETFPIPEGQVPPGGDPETSSTSKTAKPGRGTVRVVNCQRSIVKVVANNKNRDLKARYKVFIDRPGPGKKSTKRFVVKPNVKPKPQYLDLVPRTRVVLKVKKPGTNKWKKLKGIQTSSCLSGR